MRWLLIRIVALVLSFLLALVAIGPHRVQAWITWASLDNAIPPAARPTAEAEPTASVRNDAVREMHRDPRQVEEETDEEFLIRRCRELAQELYDFLKERGHGEGVEVDDPGDPRMVQRSNETVRLYRRRFEGEVLARYEVLKERRWWGDELLDPFGRNRVETVTYYGDIRVIAQRLSTIGHRL
jgi:hypothetical protein